MVAQTPIKIIPTGSKETLDLSRLDTKQEVVAGSTRLKAGTAQKICLNLISTLVMTNLGNVRNGMMINLNPNNKKLKDRFDRIKKSLNGEKS